MMTKAQLREHLVRLARKAGSKCNNCSLCKTKEAQLKCIFETTKTAQLKEHEQTHTGNPDNKNTTQRTLSVSNKDLMFVVL